MLLYAIGGQLDEEALVRGAVGLPGLAVGYLAGNAVAARLDARQFRRVVIGVLLVSAVLVLSRALAG